MARAPNISSLVEILLPTDYGPSVGAIPTAELSSHSLESIYAKTYSDRIFFPIKIASGKIKSFMLMFSRRIEVENIKRILRAKFGGREIDERELIPIPREYEIINFSAMIEAPNVDALMDYLTVSIYTEAAQYLSASKEVNSIIPLEAYIEGVYYERLIYASRDLPDKREVIGFINLESDLKSIYYILGLKLLEIDPKIISSIVVKTRSKSRTVFEEFLRLRPDIILDRLSASEYSWLVDYVNEPITEGDVILLSRRMEKALYDAARRIKMMKPLNFVYSLSYLLLVEAEYKNLVAITQGKELGLEEEEIRGLLV
jgi:V/A-type H+-transporting ATPase subunit C